MHLIKRNLLSYFCIVFAAVLAAVFSGKLYLATFAVAECPDSRPVIILDAGHGGEDGGAVSPSGVRESGINLQICVRTDALLRLLGQPTLLLREDDRSLHSESAETISEKKISDLKNRVSEVNSRSNAILVSVHQNMFHESRYSGAQVFYGPTPGSDELADSIQKSLREQLSKENRRQIKPADSVYLMNHVSCPAVLVECGFLSNAEECRRLCTPEYQKQIAMVISVETMEFMRKVMTDEV